MYTILRWEYICGPFKMGVRIYMPCLRCMYVCHILDGCVYVCLALDGCMYVQGLRWVYALKPS